MQNQVKPASGKLGILTPGMGAVSTTIMAGAIAVAKGIASPIGSLTEMGRMRINPNDPQSEKNIREIVPIHDYKNIVFGGWDIFEGTVYDFAMKAQVLDKDLLNQIKPELENITAMPAVFDTNYVKLIDGPNKKNHPTNWDKAQALREDIRNFKKQHNLDRIVVLWCGSTEAYTAPTQEHQTIEAFEIALKENNPRIAPSMIYTYAAIMEGCPYVNGAPNLSVELPALQKLAQDKQVCIAGSDFKTGQTLMKTIIAPGLKARMIGIDGWFSTNILGNRDGQVLQDKDSFKSKEVSKLGVLGDLLEPKKYPSLYGDMDHVVRINYYKPRGDNKEGWDNIDIKGWLGYPMQIKVDFLCRDSILAAPVGLDLALFADLGQRANLKGGLQEWLSFYCKNPAVNDGSIKEHDLFKQQEMLFAQIRTIGNNVM